MHNNKDFYSCRPMNTDFYRIGKESGTDKISHHGYHRFYANVIPRNIEKMLEIGIEHGSSLKMWLEYLPEAFVYGMDIGNEYRGDRHSVMRGDQSSIVDLQKMMKHIGEENTLDFIIDDGSHIPEHQVLTFVHFFSRLLKNGGIYIIEDIECSYWTGGYVYNYATNYGANHPHNIVSIFSTMSHLVNKEFIDRSVWSQMLEKIAAIYNVTVDEVLTAVRCISTITFGQNCIIIKKKDDYEHEYTDREYRFSGNTK